MSDLIWLQSWFQDHCDGDWEHGHGIRIETLDNPGWRVRIEIRGTDLEERSVPELDFQRTDDDWVQIGVDAGVFTVHCGPLNLVEAMTWFRRWVERPEEMPSPAAPPSPHVVE